MASHLRMERFGCRKTICDACFMLSPNVNLNEKVSSIIGEKVVLITSEKNQKIL